MPRPTKRRVPAGRVTAKGTRPENYTPERQTHTGFDERGPSPIWVPITMFSLLGLGTATIIVNYMGIIWDTSNVVLLVGLGFILAGIVSATQYR
ncbi:MAG: cell division protein CrgA [Acidimicrobiaceae bacterium]|nr:cell division protein CrgA [Acidimicrobiaceae bacterium]MCY4174860.1 cell division protein CrgA [Acidimicrobiaceae bacterium]MCY4281008.1 cell division protein CrgA [Acidimicrobiaceae bacterium]MCY4294859.1 cell division protein CrgA [Acidimicrobiaceae bacterium]